MNLPLLFAFPLGAAGAVAIDYGYHRLMHTPFRRGPLKRLYLYHVAHHRYPEDARILSFKDHRRLLDLVSLALFVGVFACLAPRDSTALAASVLFTLPIVLYNWSYEPLHTWVHLGGEPTFLKSRLFDRMRAHHLAHHTHSAGTEAFRRARRLSLIVPLL